MVNGLDNVEIKLFEMMGKRNIRSASKLAEMSGLSGEHIRRIINNKVSSVKLDTIIKLCEALECEIEELIVSKR